MSEYAISVLWASPALLFMYISASAPEAPPLSETTIGCFIRLFFWMAACIILAIWSEAPPAPAATTISTGLLGSHAKAGAVVSASPASALAKKPISLLMSFLLLISGCSLKRLGAPVPWHSPKDIPSPRELLLALLERGQASSPFPRRPACPSRRGR